MQIKQTKPTPKRQKVNKTMKSLRDTDYSKGSIYSEQFEVSELPNFKEVVVTSVGEENMYFEYANALGHIKQGFVKLRG